MKTAEEDNSEGVYSCGTVKTSHKVFFTGYVGKTDGRVVGGSHLVMKITPIVPGDITLMAIGYK